MKRSPSEQGRTAFGARLVKAREYARKTQKQAAEAVGMSQGTLGELEREGQGSSYTAALSEYYGVRALWLETGKGEMVGSQDADNWRALSIDVQTAANQLMALPIEQRQALLLSIENAAVRYVFENSPTEAMKKGT